MNKQNGFTLIEAMLVLIAVTLLSFAGWYVWDANKKAAHTETNDRSASAQNDTETAVDETAGWVEFTSKAGRFSLKYPSSWVTAANAEMCEDDSLLLLGPTTELVGRCASDGGGMVLVSASMHDPVPQYLSAESHTKLETREVTVDGVVGTRESGVVKAEPEGLGAPKDSTEVRYMFEANGYTYQAFYTQQPGNPDLEKEFNLIVEQTLRFN